MKSILFYLLVLSASVSANETLQKANVYAKTGFTSKAAQAYNQVLSAPLESWKQDIVRYDLGTLYLSQYLWDKATEEFIEIRGDNLPPYFKDPYNTNLGIALVGRAKQSLKQNQPITAAVDLFIAESKLGKNAMRAKLYNQALEKINNPSIAGILESGAAVDNESLTPYTKQLVDDASSASGPSKRIFLLAAAISAARRQETADQPEAVKILSKALEEQERAFDLTHLSNFYKLEGPLSPNILSVAKKEQNKAISTAKKFVPAAIDMQAHLSRQECLAKVWQEVIQKFETGLHAAENSQVLFIEGAGTEVIDDYQGEAIRLWKEALDDLKLAETEHRNAEPEKAERKSSKELIQSVIQMELQDKLPKKRVEILEKVEKPW